MLALNESACPVFLVQLTPKTDPVRGENGASVRAALDVHHSYGTRHAVLKERTGACGGETQWRHAVRWCSLRTDTALFSGNHATLLPELCKSKGIGIASVNSLSLLKQ